MAFKIAVNLLTYYKIGLQKMAVEPLNAGTSHSTS